MTHASPFGMHAPGGPRPAMPSPPDAGSHASYVLVEPRPATHSAMRVLLPGPHGQVLSAVLHAGGVSVCQHDGLHAYTADALVCKRLAVTSVHQGDVGTGAGCRCRWRGSAQ